MATRPRPHDDEIPLGGLLNGVAERLQGALGEEERWHLLMDAVVALADDRTLDELLAHITRVAADLVGARYAAIGVFDTSRRRRLRSFITHGMDEAATAAVGSPPRGSGLLRSLLEHGETLRLDDIAGHPDAYGFPEGHPPMATFLGVPIRIHDEVYGNLYLTEKADSTAFTAEDARLVEALADAAGVAIDHARVRREAARREEWLAAAAELTARVLRPDVDTDPLQIVADRARELAGADVAWVVAGPDAHHLRVRVVSGMPADPAALARLDLSGSVAAEVVRSGTAFVGDDFSADPRAVDVSGELGWDPLGVAALVPMRSAAGISGTLAVAWSRDSERAPADLDASLLALFAEQAALALHVARARCDQERLTLLEERDRIARDLHDLVIQRLFAVGLSLQETLRLAPTDPVAQRLDHAITDLDLTIADIRRAIFGLSTAPAGSDLRVGVRDVVDRAAATLKFRPHLRFEGPVRFTVEDDVAADVLAVLTEALSNAARHANPSACTVELSAREGVRLRVTDDGVGMAEAPAEASGLANMRWRAERHGGRLTVTTAPGAGTQLDWWVPSRPADAAPPRPPRQSGGGRDVSSGTARP